MPPRAARARSPVAPSRPLIEDPHWLLARVARGISFQLEQVVQRHGMSLRGQVVLAEVARTPGSSQLELSRAAAVDKSTLVGILDDLERAGLIARSTDIDDRRTKRLQPTKKGLATLNAATRDMEVAETAFFSELSEADRRSFVAALQRLVNGRLAASFDTRPC